MDELGGRLGTKLHGQRRLPRTGWVAKGRDPDAVAQRGTGHALFVEFTETVAQTGSLTGSFESTERLLLKAMPKDRVDTIMEEIRGPAGRTMWDKLGNVNEEVLANYLKNEYPQTVSVVLSKIRPDHAARVLEMLPDDFGMEVIMRMLRMEVVQKEILEGVVKTLRTEFIRWKNATATRRSGSRP